MVVWRSPHMPSSAGMKRKAPAVTDAPETQQIGRRQPQTSCHNCRAKKIKCDRGSPCASCVVRGIPCTGQPESRPAVLPLHNATDLSTDASILSRLTALERAVFGDTRQGSPANGNGSATGVTQLSPAASSQTTAVNTPSSSSHKDRERQQTAKFLDLTYTRDDHSVITRTQQPRFHIVPILCQLKQSADEFGTGLEGCSKPAVIMTRDEALLLLRDFFENPYHLLPILYEPSVRSLIDTFYTQLERGYEGDRTAAALILSIASTSASFFNHNTTMHPMFASTEEATQASVRWWQTALTILDDSRFPSDGSLEGCQARAILAYVVCNVEGCSARYRFLHSCSVAIARDMSLHLVDSTTAADTSDDLPTREIKRRLWWHLASTDWLLSLVGGPFDGTYTIQPRHFIVNRPRNLNDNDLSQNDETLTYPLNVLTQMSCFLQRIRLGEICREMVDARAPKFLDVEITDFSTVSSLDLLFERALAEMPPYLHKGAPIPSSAPSYLALQRDLILLCYNFRRARLHRPFLLHDTDDPRHESSRQQCIASARTVLSISIEMLEGPSAVDQSHNFGNPLAYRVGLVMSSMFTACAILALNVGLIRNRTTGDAHTSRALPDTQNEIIHACRVLAKAGEKSTFAANLLRNLVGVLKQYSVKEIDDLVTPHTNPNLHTDDTFSTDQSQPQPIIGDPINLADNFAMWNEFLTAMPETDGYDQLFANLDHYCGPT